MKLESLCVMLCEKMSCLPDRCIQFIIILTENRQLMIYFTYNRVQTSYYLISVIILNRGDIWWLGSSALMRWQNLLCYIDLNQALESLFIILPQPQTNDIILGRLRAIYRPPDGKVDEFNTDIEETMNTKIDQCFSGWLQYWAAQKSTTRCY